MDVSRELTDEWVRLAHRRYPDWSGFDDSAFNAEEVEYKREAVAFARERLDEGALRRLDEARRGDEVVERLKAVGGKTNLLYLATPSSGDLALLHADGLDREALTGAILDLLYGPGPSPDRLDRFSRFASGQGLPDRWALPTYFLFLVHPESELFVKPSVVLWLLDLLGAKGRYDPQPDGALYRDLLEVMAQLREQLEPYGPRDMVDLQSLLWVAYEESRRDDRFRPGAHKVREMEELFDEFLEEYVDSDGGRRHAALYEDGRERIRENLREIRQARERGEDVTERVLLGLLPYADSENNRRKGAWVCIAPAITGDLRGWFESVGWRRPGDWDEVAQEILAFFERCADRPEELEAACRAFSESPWSTGFQSGMLSPALNALDPDRFLTVNGKSRAVIGYLVGRRFGSALPEYPEVNRAGFALVEHLQEILERAKDHVPRLSDAFDMYCHWIRAVRKFPLGERYWKIAPGEGGRLWDDWRQQGYAAIGWNTLGDLSGVSREEFERRRDREGKRQGWSPVGLEQVWRFAGLQEGDRLVANRGKSEVLGIGTVAGPYHFDADGEYAHRVPVDWDDLRPRQVEEPGWNRTLIELSAEDFRRIDGAPISGGVAPPPLEVTPPDDGVAPPREPPLPMLELANRLGRSQEEIERWKEALERKGQAVLYGPPGTGKTYAALHLARHLVGGTDGMWELVQLHPAYAYEDFIQGIRPRALEAGSVDFQLVRGRFLEFCDRARQREGPCVLILDELNRAELARVFGELMYLLEYRDQAISLAAGGERFAIPANVRLLGTMNTADRSIALVDHALRRRFAFLRLDPDYETLRLWHETRGSDVGPLIEVLEALNREIRDPDYAVGITFFLHEDLTGRLESIWRLEIEPYLEEYFAGRGETVEGWRWLRVRSRLS